MRAYRGAAPSEHAATARSRKASEAIHRREFVLRDPCRTKLAMAVHCRDGCRWERTLAAGAEGHEWRELSRHAESARETGSPRAISHVLNRARSGQTYDNAAGADRIARAARRPGTNNTITAPSPDAH
jgi:hypothetical protein